MKNVAGECLRTPGRTSVWSSAQGRYVCPDAAAALAGAEGVQSAAVAAGRPASTISPTFKLVFLTAAIGTGFFTLLCVSLHLVTDGAPPPLMDKLIQGMFDLVKVGFGAIVGLLGGKALDQSASA
jgi:hypothetical protein